MLSATIVQIKNKIQWMYKIIIKNSKIYTIKMSI